MIDLINELFPDSKEIEFINNDVARIDDYIVKRIKGPINKIYIRLKNKGVDNINYPIKEIEYNNEFYYVFNYLREIKIDDETKIFNLINGLNYIHMKTMYKRKITDIEFKKLKRIYKRLDYSFLMLESIVRKCEMNEKKNDFDWIILAKYNIFLDCKRELYNLQLNIQKRIKDNLELKYVILNNNPVLDHLINDKFITMSYSKIGYFVSDFVKLYISNDFIKISFKEELDKIFDDFDKSYFKFLGLYIYILNLKFDSSDIFLTNYVNTSKLIKKFLIEFKDYK